MRNIEPQEFQLLLTRTEDRSESKTIKNILSETSVQNKKEEIQIIDVREANELERLNFSDECDRISHFPLSKRWVVKVESKLIVW